MSDADASKVEDYDLDMTIRQLIAYYDVRLLRQRVTVGDIKRATDWLVKRGEDRR